MGLEHRGDPALRGGDVADHRANGFQGTARNFHGSRDHPQKCGFATARGAMKTTHSPSLVSLSVPLMTSAGLAIWHDRRCAQIVEANDQQLRDAGAGQGMRQRFVSA